MSKSKLNKQLLEYRRQRTIAWSTALPKIVKYVATAVAAILGSRYAFLSIDSLAGLVTEAEIDVVFNIIKNTSVRNIIFLCIAIGGIIYGLWERRAIVRKIPRLTKRNKFLEEIVDKNRQSSRLSRTGSTRKEDE